MTPRGGLVARVPLPDEPQLELKQSTLRFRSSSRFNVIQVELDERAHLRGLPFRGLVPTLGSSLLLTH